MAQVERLTLEVGGVAIAVTAPSEWIAPLETRYAGYLTACAASWRVTLDYNWGLGGQVFEGVEHNGPVTRFGFSAYGGWIDLANRVAGVSTSSDHYAMFALQRLLVYIYMQALPHEQSALLLHASGVVRHRAGYVFMGPSGAGKTTVTRLAAGYGQVLCDENVVLRVGNNGPEVLATPFWGTGWPDVNTGARLAAPLQAIYVLEHTPDFRLTKLAPAQAVLALLDSERVPVERPESSAAWLAVAERLLSEVPAYRLGFRPTVELWAFLDKHQDKLE